MAAEITDTIAGLIETAPAANSQLKDGDDHIRLLKHVLVFQLGSLGNVALVVTGDELNRLQGLNGNIMDLLNAKAPLASPVFTGIPRAPTPNVSDSSTQIATTAFVNAVAMSGVPPEITALLEQLQEELEQLPEFGTAAERDVGTSDGQVMLVGAFGLGATDFSAFNGDCNDIAVSAHGQLIGDSATNSPFPGEFAFLICWSNGANDRVQMAFPITAAEDPVWRRSSTGSGGYTSWAGVAAAVASSIPSSAETFNGAESIDVQAKQIAYGALTGNATFAFSNIPAAGYYEWRLRIANPGSYTWTFPSHGSVIKWPGSGSQPGLPASGTVEIRFSVVDFGTTNKIWADIIRHWPAV